MLISASASSETIQTPWLRQPDHLLHHRLGLGDGDQDEPRMDQVERVWRQSTPARITLAHQHVVELSLADQLSRQLDVSRFNVEADHPPRRPHALRQHLERSPRATPEIDRLRSGRRRVPGRAGPPCTHEAPRPDVRAAPAPLDRSPAYRPGAPVRCVRFRAALPRDVTSRRLRGDRAGLLHEADGGLSNGGCHRGKPPDLTPGSVSRQVSLVTLWTCAGRAGSMRVMEPFVGRVAELETLARAAGEARAGHSSVVVIEGEAGMGKSSLLNRWLNAEPAEVLLRASGDEEEQMLAYGVVSQVLTQAARAGAGRPALPRGRLKEGETVQPLRRTTGHPGDDRAQPESVAADPAETPARRVRRRPAARRAPPRRSRRRGRGGRLRPGLAPCRSRHTTPLPRALGDVGWDAPAANGGQGGRHRPPACGPPPVGRPPCATLSRRLRTRAARLRGSTGSRGGAGPAGADALRAGGGPAGQGWTDESRGGRRAVRHRQDRGVPPDACLREVRRCLAA